MEHLACGGHWKWRNHQGLLLSDPQPEEETDTCPKVGLSLEGGMGTQWRNENKTTGPPGAAQKLSPKDVPAELRVRPPKALRAIRAIKHFAKVFELDPKTMGNH